MVEPWHVSVTWIIRVWLFMKSEFNSWNICLYILCTTMQVPDPHLSVDHHRGFYSIFFVDSKSCAWSFTSQHTTSKSSTPSFIRCLDDSGNQDSTPSEYWQPIPQKCSYMGMMSLEYFSISPSGQGQQIILDAVMSWVCTVTWNLKALALMDVIWFVYQV